MVITLNYLLSQTHRHTASSCGKHFQSEGDCTAGDNLSANNRDLTRPVKLIDKAWKQSQCKHKQIANTLQ